MKGRDAMSATMIMGRVVLPASAVLLLGVVAWNSMKMFSVRAGSAGEDRAERRAAPRPSGRITAEGRVTAYPGGEVTVGTEVLGTIVGMPARERAAVHRGDVLVQLRDDEVRASLAEARSRLTQAEVALRVERARYGLDRLVPGLARQAAGPPEARREALTAAEAGRDAARAAVDRLEAEAARYRILAPIDGVVIARHVDPGETVAPAAPLVTVADLSRLRVEAEVDEFDIPRIAPGATATISAEGYAGTGWRGRVEEIADAVSPRRTRPEDPGRPADTRVLLVRVAFLEKVPLKLGQRVEVEIARASGE
jgi:RND family efflux transporter MFP subunit